jgi:hypothetical protein
MTQVNGQITPQEQARAGAGSAVNPWAEYGLNPDGTQIVVKEEAKSEPGTENAELKAQVAALEAKLQKLPEGFEGLTEKMKMVDRLVGALQGDSGDPNSKRFNEIYQDLKQVAKVGNPGLAQLLNLLEDDPQWLSKVQHSQGALMANHVVGLNERAHNRVIELARKAGFKGGDETELNEMVFPFEQSMTMMINANPELRQAFLSGNVGVVDQIFNRLIKPHVGQRLREKQARTGVSLPKAPPKGGSSAGSSGEESKPTRNLATPKGRADFHKQAVGRWLDKISSKSDD